MRIHLATIFALLLSGASLFAAACDSAQLKQAPPDTDAGVTSCSNAAQVECDAAAPSETACTGNASATGYAAQLPTTTSYATGCQAFFQSADCSTLASCSCTRADDAGQAAWECTK